MWRIILLEEAIKGCGLNTTKGTKSPEEDIPQTSLHHHHHHQPELLM